MLNQKNISSTMPFNKMPLTALLSEFLGGNCFSILCLDIEANKEEKQIHSLEFLKAIRRVKNRIWIDNSKEQLETLETVVFEKSEKVEKLERKLLLKEAEANAIKLRLEANMEGSKKLENENSILLLKKEMAAIDNDISNILALNEHRILQVQVAIRENELLQQKRQFREIQNRKSEIEIEIQNFQKQVRSLDDINQALKDKILAEEEKATLLITEKEESLQKLKLDLDQNLEENAKLVKNQSSLSLKEQNERKQIEEQLQELGLENEALVSEKEKICLQLEKELQGKVKVEAEKQKLLRKIESSEQRISDLLETVNALTEEREALLSQFSELKDSVKSSKAAQLNMRKGSDSVVKTMKESLKSVTEDRDELLHKIEEQEAIIEKLSTEAKTLNTSPKSSPKKESRKVKKDVVKKTKVPAKKAILSSTEDEVEPVQKATLKRGAKSSSKISPRKKRAKTITEKETKRSKSLTEKETPVKASAVSIEEESGNSLGLLNVSPIA